MQEAGSSVMLNASATTFDSSLTVAYDWDFGDNTTGEGEVVSHTYSQDGEYTITLTVSDIHSSVAPSTFVMTFNTQPADNRAPVASFEATVDGLAVSVDATDSRDPDGDLISYAWDFGDSSASQNTATADYTYATAGEYTITLTVSDTGFSDDATKTVTVRVPNNFVGDSARGKALYEGTELLDGDNLLCSVCHGVDGQGNDPLTINPYLVGSKNAFDKISATMPPGEAIVCDGQCAADIEAYLLTWEPVVHEVMACGDHLTYGARQLKLLTREEYQNSMVDLVGIDFDLSKAVPDDTYIHGYSNHITAAATQVHVDNYMLNAEQVAAWSRENNFAGVIDCSSLSIDACADEFVDGFAMRAFRRPLTTGEANTVKSFFEENYSDSVVEAGIEVAMTAVLTSPIFLYRSEQGEAVMANEYDGRSYEFVDASEVFTASDFTDKREVFPDLSTVTGSEVFGATPMNGAQPAKLGKHMSFSGDGTLFKVSMRAVREPSGPYPEVNFRGPGFSIDMIVDWDEFKTIYFYIPGLGGTSELSFNKSPTESKIEVYEFEYGPGQLIPNSPDVDAYELTPYEIATFLSYTYTGSTPDANLLEAAANNELDTNAQISLQIERLLSNPKSVQRMGNFAAQWLGSDGVLTEAKDTERYPELTDEIRRSMAQEVRELFTHVIFDDTQSIDNLYNSDYVFVDSILSEYYGLGSVAGDDFVKVDGMGERGGMLTTGAFHVTYATSDEASPIYRAVAAREHFLCQDIPPPPAGVSVGREAAEEAAQAELDADWLSGNMTNRRRYHLLTQGEGCGGCHDEIINPLGFGMEDFDTIGRHRTLDLNNQTIDATGTLYGITNMYDFTQSLEFTGSKGLGHELSQLDNVKECFVSNMFRYAVGLGHHEIDKNNADLGELTPEEEADYSCSIVGMNESMTAANGNPKVMLQQLGALNLVRYRKEQARQGGEE